MNIAEVHEIRKAYAHFDLYIPEFSIPYGSITGLIGENGAGKTTLIRILTGITKADSGSVTVLGSTNVRDRKMMEDIGMVTDEEALVPFMNAKQTGTMMQGIFRNWDSEAYHNYIRILDIPEETAFGELSRGNRMKTALACAMSHHAKFLVLDEATGGLDPVVRDHVLEILTDYAKEKDHAVLLSSHIVSDLEKACTDIAFLHRGRLILNEKKDTLLQKTGTIEELFLKMVKEGNLK